MMREYELETRGIRYTAQFSEEEAARRGLTEVKARVPVNKARLPEQPAEEQKPKRGKSGVKTKEGA